ncbi:hypothetical protein V1511DRAFT_278381 [Dipodascopsis uninucleata]
MSAESSSDITSSGSSSIIRQSREESSKSISSNSSKNHGSSIGGNDHRRRGRRSKNVNKFLSGDKGPVDSLQSSNGNSSVSPEDRIESSEPSAPGSKTEICFICAEPVKYSAVSPCNHRSCHICALRMRALYKTNACVHCRTSQEKIIFTIDNSKRYEDYTKQDIVASDSKLGIDFDRLEIQEDTKRLLQLTCPDKKCDTVCQNWTELRRHVREVHHRSMCQLCTRNKKVFTHEHKLYTAKALAKHERTGDEEGFTGHPECQFCKDRYYSVDELRVHYRERHERCHICDKHLVGNSEPQYFFDYQSLEQHFKTEHFLCPAASCLEKKFVVFEDEIDLKAHQLSEHPNMLGSGKSARLVETNFHFGVGHQSSAVNGSSGQSRRQNGRRNNRIGFGSQLSSDFDRLHVNNDLNSRTNDPVRSNSSSDLIQFRHQILDERAASHLNRDSPKYSEFRRLNTAYKDSDIQAKELISGYLNIFDTDSNEMTIIIHEFAELFNDEKPKKDAILSAWSDWRARNEDYPELPTTSSVANQSGAMRSSAVVRKPLNVGSVWSGAASSQPSLSSSTRSSIPAPGSQVSRMPMSKPASARTSPSQFPSISSLQSSSFPSASAAYANTWQPSSTPNSVPQKLSFTAQRPVSSAASTSSSSSSSSKIVRNNLKEFPSLPPAKKKIAPYVSTKSSAASSSNATNGWAQSATSRTEDELQPESFKTVKKGKKSVVVFR